MPQVACVWKAPFTSVQILPGLPGTDGSDTYPTAITPDGATVVGQARASDSTWRAVRWNTATLAITELARVIPNARAIGVSADGAVIVGATTASTGGAPSQLIRWTGGGAAGALLPITGDGPSAVFRGYGNDGTYGLISDDGSVIGGWILNGGNPYSGVTKWINGVGTNLPGLATNVTDLGPEPGAVSSNGSIMVGLIGQHNQTDANPNEAGYWVGTTLRRLVVPPEHGAGIGNLYAIQCNHDASVIWGDTPNLAALTNTACYWTNTSTLSGDGVHYGVSHIMAQLPNTQQQRTIVFWVADDPSALVAVGTSPVGASDTRPCKWVGTTAFALPTIDDANGVPSCCNHDGTVICGSSSDNSFATWPVRWDASNALHVLPTLADAGDSYQGEALGVSREGSVIFGIIDVAEIPPIDPPPTPTPLALSENLISLSVSYDRGHSFGSPVSQPMGQPGEYRKSLLWRRLGHGRDAVFKLEWSSARPTALQGCWLDADIGDGGQEKK